jgi:uncharacterized protein
MKSVIRLSSLRLRTVTVLLLSLQLSLPVAAASLDDLLNAAKLGDAGEVAQLVARGMDANSTDQSGNTLLILAAREEQPKVVAELIKQRGIKLDARNAAGDSALMLASLRGYTGIVDQLLAAGAPFDHTGWNPLLYAAFEGHKAIIEKLLAKGANPNALAPNRTTALMFAARNGHENVVTLLLKAGADLDWKNDQNETADTWAAKNRNTNIAELIQSERKARAARGK